MFRMPNSSSYEEFKRRARVAGGFNLKRKGRKEDYVFSCEGAEFSTSSFWTVIKVCWDLNFCWDWDLNFRD